MSTRRPYGRPPTAVVLACACMLPGTLLSLAALVGLALFGFRDPDPVLLVTVPSMVVFLLLAALHVLGLVRAWRAAPALLRLAALLTIGAVVLFFLGGLWTWLDEGDVDLEPSLLVVPVLGVLAAAAVFLLRKGAASASSPARAEPATPLPIAGATGLRPLITIAALMSATYGLYVLVDLFGPKLTAADPALSIFADLAPAWAPIVFWGVLTSWLAVSLVALMTTVGRRGRPASAGGRRSPAVHLLVVGLLLAPFPVVPLNILVRHPLLVLACVPSTAFALWAVRRAQRYRRLPLGLLLGALAWGALVATGLAGALVGIFVNFAYALVFNDGQNPLGAARGMFTSAAFQAGVVEELSKGAGLAMAFVALRRHLDSVVAGVALGAAVGLGFNLVESVEFMAAGDGASAEFQYWMRQSVGLLGAHTAFSGVVGAGFGVARQLRNPRLARLAIACGFVTAVGAHVATNMLSLWYSQAKAEMFAPTEAVDILVLQPLLFVVLHGPLVVLSVLLIRRGLRGEAAGLTAALHTEASTGLGAVSAAEIPVLLSPAQRLWLAVMVLRRHGLAAARRLRKVQAAQLDLATQHWQRLRQDADPAEDDERALRERVLHLKRGQLASSASARSQVGMPA